MQPAKKNGNFADIKNRASLRTRKFPWLSDAIIETKYRKIGCMVGDYVKTAVGTNINTGN